ncbi:hypothetical protein FOL47_005154 [Perkinsus chesapeaki]|uniref:Uncharacterized protein n=1 Tax=Perkinsus chesapeaki TaxID=330153 RepID=A0A7J6LYK5_PERCH|nr:hypothetical protein FOL47_005154 [Perkinsus chesapeaki]
MPPVTSSGSYATNWWSMQGLRDIQPEEPEDKAMAEKVYLIVDELLDIADEARARSKIGVLVRKGGTELKEFFKEITRGTNATNFGEVWRAVFVAIYWCTLDSGLGDGAAELAYCLSLCVMRLLVKLQALESIFNDNNSAMIGRIAKGLGLEAKDKVPEVASDQVQNKIELNSLPLVEAAPWNVDTKESSTSYVTYEIFKKRVVSGCRSYQLKGRLACYYLTRNLVGRAKTFCQDQLAELNDLDDLGELQEDIFNLLWERLDTEYASQWSEGRAASNFSKLYKRSDENVLAFGGRVQELAASLPALTAMDVRNQFLKGLPGPLVAKLKTRYGAKLYSKPLASIIDTAEFFERDFQDSKQQGFLPGKGFSVGKGQGGRQHEQQFRRDSEQRQVQWRPSSRTSEGQSSIKCFNCQNYGHIARDCPKRQPPVQAEKNGKAQSGVESKPNSSPNHKTMAVEVEQGSIEIASIEEKESKEFRSLTLATACPPSTCKVTIDEVEHEALIDSGSALALISESLAKQLEVKRRLIAPLRAIFANRQTQLLTEETIIPCTVGGKDLLLPFLIASGLSFDLILGRSALRLCGAKLVYRFDDESAFECIQQELLDALRESDSSRNRSEPLPRERNGAYEFSDVSFVEIINPERIDCSNVELQGSLSSSFSGDDLAVLDAVNQEIEEGPEESEQETQEWVPADVPKTVIKRDWSDCDSIDKCFEKLANEGWISVNNAEGYRIRLVRLTDEDVRDTPTQKYRFMVDWDETKSKGDRRSWSPNRLLQKLSPEQYELWLKELEMYENRQWWERVFPGEVPDDTATAFPVVSMAKTTKVRPVIDARVLNVKAPVASSKKHSVASIVQKLRGTLTPGKQVRQYDLARAFYRLAISHPIFINYGRGITMRSTRLSFGLAIGPGALEQSLDLVWSILEHYFPTVTTIRMMDDILVISCQETLENFELILNQTLNLVGFDIPEEKKAVWSTDYSKWLGAYWSWDGSVLRMKPPLIEAAVSNCKRDVFCLAGRFISLWFSLEEVQARSHCDWARRISASQSLGFDDPLPPDIHKEVNNHLFAAVEAWARIPLEVPLLSVVKILVIGNDASNCGYASVWYSIEKNVSSGAATYKIVIIGARSHLFARNATYWHANRRELFCLSSSLGQFCSLLINDHFPQLESVMLASDSTTAIRRLDDRPHKMKGVEWLATSRLRECCIDMLRLVRSHKLSIRFIHVSASQNAQPDLLSRIDTAIPAKDIRSLPQVAEDLCTGIDVVELDCCSVSVATIDNLPSFQDYVLLSNCFQAWRNGDVVSVGDIFTRFIQSQQHKDTMAAESIKVLESSNPSFDKCPKNIQKYAQHMLMVDGILCKVSTKPSEYYEDSPKIVLPSAKYASSFVNEVSAEEVSRVFENEFLLKYSCPRCVITDNGVQFVKSINFDTLLSLYHIKHVLIPVYHPSSGSFYERPHAVVNMALRALLEEDPKLTLKDALGLAQARVNTTVDTILGITPHEAVYGFPLQSPLAQWASSQVSSSPINNDDIIKYVSHFNKKNSSAISSACEKLRIRRTKILEDWKLLWQSQKPQSPNPIEKFEEGDEVLVWHRPSHKLDRMWREGVITRKIGSRCYEVKLPDGRKQVYSSDHLKVYLDGDVDLRDSSRNVHSRPSTSLGSGEPRITRRAAGKFVTWKDPYDSISRYGLIKNWTGRGEYLVQECRLWDNQLRPLYIGNDGKLSVTGDVEALVKLSPRIVRKVPINPSRESVD